METTDPREQKALGRKVRGFDAAEWERHGYDVVVRGNYEKFRQNPTFLQRLLDTGDKVWSARVSCSRIALALVRTKEMG